MNQKNYINIVKSGVVVIGSYIGNLFDVISPAIILLIILTIVDYFSGMLASKKEAVEHPNDKKYGWSSKKSIIGIYKKLGYILSVLVALSTDYLIYALLREVGVEYQIKTLFGLLVTIWFIINELLSILENAGRMGVVLPKFLQNVLSELKRDINDFSEK